jgi:hypothetical protein
VPARSISTGAERMLTRLFAFGLTTAFATLAAAAEPLHARIDALLAARAGADTVADIADDAEFLRRVYLDLAGRIPSVTEARAFLADAAADKRTKLIDKLLAGPDYPRRMQEFLHIMLMERRGDDAEWNAYLRRSAEKNKPLDRLVRELLNPDIKDADQRGAGFFLTKRLEKYGENPVDYPGLTRDVGRLLLGVDLQCAQCHNHLFVKEYKQADFQGLYVFFQNTFLAKSGRDTWVAEKPLTTKIEYQSVFDKIKKTVGPRLPGGKEFEIPPMEKGKEYSVPPNAKTKAPGVPKFSTLALLADHLPTAENAAFGRNAVNRFWWMMMGRGIVHPLDMHHRDNAPTNPELLEALAKDFAESKFDVKRLLREIALTQAYQRSSLIPAGKKAPPPEKFLAMGEKRLSAEQIYWSSLLATGEAEFKAPAGAAATQVRDRFVRAFANPAQEPEVDIAPSLQSALFVLNEKTILDRLAPSAGNLIDRLTKLDTDKIAEELFLAVLTRPPTAQEKADVAAFLKKHPAGDAKALGRLAWALLAGTEFAVNH